MVGAALCVAVSLIGVDAGCKRLPDGSLQYIVQVTPEQWDAVRSGEFAVEGDFPAELNKDVRGYRICVGTAKLPQEYQRFPSPPRSAVSQPSATVGAESPRTSGRTEPAEPFVGANPHPDRSRLPWDPAPRPLPSNPDSKPVADKPAGSAPVQPTTVPQKSVQPAKQASYLQTQETESRAAPKAASVGDPPDRPASDTTPSVPLALAVTGFCGSLGGNMYLGLLLWEARRRHRALLRRSHQDRGTDRAAKKEPERTGGIEA